MYDPDEAFAFYADYIYDSYPENWDKELENQSRQIQLESDIRHGWKSSLKEE